MRNDYQEMTVERTEKPLVRRRFGLHFFLFIAFHLLIIWGICQGDYRETLLNGTTL